jgi:hypothetical protein
MGVGLVDVVTQAQQTNPVAALLFQNKLSRYAGVFDEEGYDNLEELQQWAKDADEDWRMLLMRSKMKPNHVRNLRKALGVGVEPRSSSEESRDTSILTDTEEDTEVPADDATAGDNNDDAAAATAADAADKVDSAGTGTGEPSRRHSLTKESMKISEEAVSVQSTTKKKDAAIREVIKQVAEMATVLGHMHVTSQHIELSFEEDQVGDEQQLSVYNASKAILLAMCLTTQTKARGQYWGSKHCISATGSIRCCKAVGPEGIAKLEAIAAMGDAGEKAYEIEQLIQKLMLPNLPSAEFILLLHESDYKKKANKCRSSKPAIEPYSSSDFKHKQLLNSFKVYGAHRFTESTVYRVHPDLRLRTFVPVDQYDQLMIESKRAEFVNIARQLCAKSIKVKKEEKDESSSTMTAGASAVGAGEGGGGQEDSKSKEKSQSMDQVFSEPKEMVPQFHQEETHFYQWEESWKTMKQGRMDTDGAQTLSYECKFSYSADVAKSKQLKAGMQGIGLDFGGSKEEHSTIDETCTVEFWSSGLASTEPAPSSK